MIDDEIGAQELYKAVIYRHLIYLKYLALLGYQIEQDKIKNLELEVYPELNDPSNTEYTLGQRELDELQLLLCSADPLTYDNNSTKALIIRLEHTVIRMRGDNNHQRPHFHIEYKQEYDASYAIDTLERLAGDMPTKYEKKLLEWAAQHQDLLHRFWNTLKAGNSITELLLEAEKSY